MNDEMEKFANEEVPRIDHDDLDKMKFIDASQIPQNAKVKYKILGAYIPNTTKQLILW